MSKNSVRQIAMTCGEGIKGFCYGSPRHVITYFVHGLIMMIPLAVTIWVIVWLFNLIDGVLSPILTWAFGRPMPGMGFGILIISLVLIGYFGVKVGHRRTFDFVEGRLIKIPILGSIYGGTRQILTSFTTSADGRFLKVVFIEFPRKGIYTVGLVTCEVTDRNKRKILNVFIPTAPNPTSGFLQIIPESDVIHSSMSVSDAMKLIVSAGKVSRTDIADMLGGFPEPESTGQVVT